MKRIAIVGGGPGGLLAALLLKQKSARPLDVTIFEADGRLGGKVLTGRFSVAPVPYEAGVAELYRYRDDPLYLLITKVLKLPVVAMNGKTVVFENHIVRNEGDIRRCFGKKTADALHRFHKTSRALRRFPEFYDSGWPKDNRHPWQPRSMASVLKEVPDKVARRYLETLIHSDLATEPSATHGLYGLENYLINDDNYCRLYSIAGGIERLIDGLRGAITARVRLDAPVQMIEKSGEEAYRIHSRSNERAEAEEFDAVVVALPNPWLSTISWGGERLRAAMTAHHQYYNHPAHYLRITALFREPFWGDQIQGSFFLHDAFGGCCVYDEGTRHDVGPYGVLGWLLSGSEALALSGCSDQILFEKALASLPPVFSGARDHFLEGRVHRWIGSVNGQPGGPRVRGSKRRHVPEPRDHPGLAVVGDYLFDSTINGAFDSADIATDLVLDHLGVTRTIVKGDYFDSYDSKRTYEESLAEAFDERYVADMIDAGWGMTPPYRLLDAGSANGLTLALFGRLGIEAWGIENSWYIHAKTPRHLEGRNILGDICKMPFPDNHFDFVYETCLVYIPPDQLDQAIRELYRVTRRGVLFGSPAKDMRRRVVKKYDLFYGAANVLTLEQWGRLFLRHGFRLAVTNGKALKRIWKIEKAANQGEPWYPSPESMAYCFFTKDGGGNNGDALWSGNGHRPTENGRPRNSP